MVICLERDADLHMARNGGVCHSSKPTAAGLLLWAWQAADIDRLLQQRWANKGSAM